MVPAGTHPAVVWGILIGSEIPDSDFVVRYWGGPHTYLRVHRGPTHGLIVQPLSAAIIAVLLQLVWPEAPFWPLFCWTLAGCLSHVIFDFGNDYGTQGLWPFSKRWIATDIIPIVDLGLIALIAGGWAVNALLNGPRQAIFGAVWVLIGGYVLVRYILRRKAVEVVRARFDLKRPSGEHAPSGEGWREERLTVHPPLLSLNVWRYVVQMPGEFWVGLVRLSDGKVSEPVKARNQLDKIVKASLKSQIVSLFANWVRRPRVEVLEKDGMHFVNWSDMRYEVEDFSPFSAYAVLDEQLTLIDEGLGSQRPKHVDKEAVLRRLRLEMGRMD